MNTNNLDSTYLSTKLKEFIDCMKGGGYTSVYLDEIYRRTNRNFINYCLNNNIEFKSDYIDFFLSTYYGNDCTRYKRRKRAILCFINFIKNNEMRLIKQCNERIILSDNYKNINSDFYSYVVSNGTKEVTAKKKEGINKLFLYWLEKNSINSVELITKDNIFSYMNQLENYSSEYKRKIRETMKIFLNWLYLNQKISFDGNSTIIKTKNLKNTVIPSFYTVEEIKNAIKKVDRNTIIGKRDYLILLLLSHYGFRAGDLLNLKFNNLDFTNNKINIIQNKTKIPLSLPMFDEIRYAFLDYLKNSRPTSNNDFIFVSYALNHQKYKNVVTFGNVVTKYLKLADVSIENKHHSSHSFRHSLATNLLLNNTPITSIESILGHSNVSSTEIYLQLDFNKLKDLCLEVPYEI